MLTADVGQFRDVIGDPRVLPDKRIRNRAACFAIPEHRCFTLVCNPHRGDIFRQKASLRQGLPDYVLRGAPNLSGIVFDPAGTRIYLPVLFLRAGDGVSCAVKYQATGAGRALIKRCYVVRHEQLWYRKSEDAHARASLGSRSASLEPGKKGSLTEEFV